MADYLKIGPYVVEGMLATSEFSHVFAAQCDDTDRRVVLKVIKTSNLENKLLLKKEYRIHKSLKHENVLPVEELVDHHNIDLKIFVMDRANTDLFECIVYNEALETKTARHVFIQLLNAIEHVHKAGYVHRDIKPENILVDDDWHIYLTDFGFATELYDENNEPLRLTEGCGSPPYVAPEVMSRNYEGKPTDVWSACVTLFAMLTGQTPWELPTHQCWEFTAIVQGNFDFPPWNTIDEGPLDIIKAVLVLDPKKRKTIKEIRQMPWLAECVE